MKLRRLLIAPVLGGFLFVSACSNPFAPAATGTDAPEISPEIKSTFEQYVAKLNAHDAAGAGELYADDSTFLWVEDGKVLYETHIAAVSGLTNFFSGFPESHFEAYDVKVSMLTDESAIVTFKFNQTVSANAQASIKFEGVMSLVMADRDGDWKIVAGHRSSSSYPR